MSVKGIRYVKLSASGDNTDLHSSNTTIVPNPIWRLIWALNNLKDENERILIPGFYESVREPTPAEIDALERMGFDEDGASAASWICPSSSAVSRARCYWSSTSFNPPATCAASAAAAKARG